MQSYGIIGLIIIAFAGSSFFPIPPDVLLIPMMLIHRELALFYALITTVFSVLGALLGYFVGKKFGKPILKKLFKQDYIETIEYYFNKYGTWSIAISGFTPMPYKIFTIAAGSFNTGLSTLTIASIIGRGTRFFLEALFVIILGDRAMYYLEHHFGTMTIIVTIVFICIYGIFRYLFFYKKADNVQILTNFKFHIKHHYSRVAKYNKLTKIFISILFITCTTLLALFLATFIRHIK